MFGLAQRAVLLAPAEDAFDRRAAALGHAIPFKPRGAAVDGAFAGLAGFGRSVVLSDMRRHPDVAQRRDMIAGVVGLVFANRYGAAGVLAFGFEHRLRCAPLGHAVGVRHHTGDRETVAVLHGGVPHITELCLAARGLAVEPAVRIGRARMGLVAALLLMKVRAVAAVAAVLGAEALVRSPGFNQRAIHRKMFVRQ